MIQLVLLEPEIPFNTGAIGRTCVATNTPLHMIKPYGFILNDRNIKRAGMDYWPKLKLTEYTNYEDFLQQHPEISFEHKEGEAEAAEDNVFGGKAGASPVSAAAPRLWYATTKAPQCYSDVHFGPNDFIMMGKESAGIPETILRAHPENCIRIPMWGDMRSLNLSNAAAIVLYEALRQNGFEKLEKMGKLGKARQSLEKETAEQQMTQSQT